MLGLFPHLKVRKVLCHWVVVAQLISVSTREEAEAKPGLQSGSQDSQGYTEKSQKQNKQTKTQENKNTQTNR